MCIVGVIITFQTIVQHANYCFPEHNVAISKSVQNPKHSVYCNKWQKEANPHIWEVATGESFIFFFFSSLFLCLFIFKAITIKFHDYSVSFFVIIMLWSILKPLKQFLFQRLLKIERSYRNPSAKTRVGPVAAYYPTVSGDSSTAAHCCHL